MFGLILFEAQSITVDFSMVASDATYTMAADIDQGKAREKILVPNEGDPSSAGAPQPTPKPPYSALSTGQRRLILAIVTAAGFLGPLAGGIYLPALPTLEQAFHTSATAVNATVSVFMAILAVAVRISLPLLDALDVKWKCYEYFLSMRSLLN